MATSPNLNPRLHSELFKITDRVRKLEADPESLTVEDYRALLRDLCSSIQKSLDNNLRRALLYAQNLANDPEVTEHAKNIVADFSVFSEFLSFEKEALIGCGVDEETAGDIVSEIEGLRDELSNPEYDIEKVESSLGEFHNKVCMAASLTDAQLNSDRDLNDQKKQKLITYGTGLTLANAAGIAATMGAATPVLFLSTAAGGLMIAWRGTLNDPGERKPG